MNAIKHHKLTMALGAALVAAAMSTPAVAQDTDFSNFSRQARETVLNEVTAQPGPAGRLSDLRGGLTGARVVPGLAVNELRDAAQSRIRAETLASVRASAPSQLAASMNGARVTARVADANPPGNPVTEWSLPEVEFKPLIDMSLLHFSFRK